MRGVYTAVVKVSALAAARTLMLFTVPTNKVVEIIEASVTNDSNATNQMLEVTFQQITTLGTPTATTLTPSPHEAGDQAAGSTVKGNVTASEPTYTANTDIGHEGFSSVNGWYYDPVPETRFIMSGGASWGLRMLSTPTSFDCQVRVCFREIG